MTRLGTVREGKEFVALEQDPNGYLWLVGKGEVASFRMPACLEDAKIHFGKLGRDFDPGRLPVKYVPFFPGIVP